MIGPSKILTVSYGTFSCTLEGFDDPFNTMRAIAEYFRDLAAGDRYFGAEPPIPDAAMLHKIAEREIHRRVEAKIQENGVILRTGDALSPAARIAAPVRADAPSPVLAPVTAAPTFAAPTFVAPGVAAPSVAPEAPAGVESAAQRLSRLRAAQIVEPARTAVPVSVAAPAALASIETYAEDQDVEDSIVAVVGADLPEDIGADADLADLRALDGDADQPDTTAPDLAVIAFVDQLVPEDAEAFPEAEADTPQQPLIAAVDQIAQDDTTAEAVPEMDAEISAFLTEAADQPAAPADVPEPAASDWLDSESLSGEVIENADHLIDFATSGPDELDGFDFGPAVAEADIVEPEADMAEPQADDGSDSILAAVSGLSQPDAAPARALDVPEADLDDGFDLAGAVNDSIAASLADAAQAQVSDDVTLTDQAEEAATAASDQRAAEDAPAEDAPAVDAPDEDPPPVADEPAALPAEAAFVAAAPVAPAAQVGEKLQRARARVIKIRRADAPALVIGRGPAPALAPPVDAVAVTPDGLSDAAEAALQRELAALQPEPQLDASAEAALRAALDNTVAPLAVDLSTDLATPQPTALAGVDAVDRLMAETNSHLEVPETKRRQSAIAHLKAAVAATIADRLSNPRLAAQKAEARLDPYRKDLEQVVGPARPGEPMGADRPAPLVLVSSQRIDRPKPGAAAPRVVQPVRPRRVTTAGPALRSVSLVGDDDIDEIASDRAENIFSASPAQSFAEFAERLGVTTMPDMLEAAAAYCALVLGRDQFSRPLLLETLAGLPGAEDTSLEDSLRGFGTLLRDGRITKVRRGQFQLSQDSHVLTEAKRFAG